MQRQNESAYESVPDPFLKREEGSGSCVRSGSGPEPVRYGLEPIRHILEAIITYDLKLSRY